MTDAFDSLAEAASLDPAVRSRVLALANLALDEAEYLIRYGDPSMKSSIIRTMMTAFSRHLRAEEKNSEIEELKHDMEKLQDIMLGRIPGFTPDPPEPPDPNNPFDPNDMAKDTPPPIRIVK